MPIPDAKFFAGIDVGTTTTKAVLLNADRQLAASFVRRSGTDLGASANTALEQALERAGSARAAIQAIVATGYGRRNVSFADDTKTEIACHGWGCHYYYPETIAIVDIGGQDSKVIKLDAQGKTIGFKMNRKCAAGTGAFLEDIARRLDLPVGELNGLARAARQTAKIGSYCTVFTATEVLDRIRQGERTDEIVRGLFDSIVKRVMEMDALVGKVVMTGGVVAYHDIVAELLSARVKTQVLVAPHPQEMGAFGAALFAAEM